MALCRCLTEASYFIIVLFLSLPTGYQFTAGWSNSSASTSETTVHSNNSHHLEPARHLNSNANNSNSNWVLILVIVTLFVGAVFIIIQISLQTWRAHAKRKRKYENSDTERRLLLRDQGVEVVERHQQPSATGRNDNLSDQLGSNISISIKQQMPTDESFTLPAYSALQ